MFLLARNFFVVLNTDVQIRVDFNFIKIMREYLRVFRLSEWRFELSCVSKNQRLEGGYGGNYISGPPNWILKVEM